jgi:hypothetical protein
VLCFLTYTEFNHSILEEPKMPPMTLERIAVQCCKSCAHVLNSDSSETQLRCGLGYYLQPPLTRKQGRMDSYPVVEAHERCGRWRDSLKGVLKP